VPVGHVISNNVNPPLSQNEILAYYAPFPDSTYKMAMRSFPEMVPEDTTWAEAIANNAAWGFMESFQKPFMTIFGEFDAVSIPSARMDFINRVPGAYGQPHTQLNVTHYAPEDKPDEVADEIIAFLSDIYHPNNYQNIIYNEFNLGFDSFADGGTNCEWDNTLKSIKLSANNGASSSTLLSNPIDLSNIEVLKIGFKYVSNGVENGEKLHIELWNGNVWQPILTLIAGVDFVNGGYDYGFIRVSKDSVTFSPNANIRIRCEASDNSDIFHLLDIGIYAREETILNQTRNDFVVYPNPLINSIIIKDYPEKYKQFHLSDATGRLIISGRLNSLNTEVNLDQLPAGIYFLGLKSENEKSIFKKLIKK
jgi:haloalkane dehalogenase